ncbi:MAG: IS110 family transposase [Oscillospiraceae bacterium]|nr:IS110 family transposase [Oscillospiraceae bacterium]
MNSVGIDVSKGKSTVAIMRPLEEVVASPFEVSHTDSELSKLAEILKSLKGETKVVMESTGSYHLPIAHALHGAGLFVSVVNPQLTHKYDNNSIRKSRNDSTDAIKIANYTLTNWLKLSEYIPPEDIRHMLKTYSRQYNKYGKIKTMLKNNLISLFDQTFPNVNELFTSPPRKSDGHEKWLDFGLYFWHCECICSLTPKVFAERYRKWCKRSGYNFSQSKADDVYAASCGRVSVIPKNEITKLLITQAINQVTAVSETLATVAAEMNRLAALLPEYDIAMGFCGVGDILGPQIMAEIGDIYFYAKKSSIVRFFGLEPVENQSGKFRGKETISKQGSPHLRKTLFQVMDCLLQTKPLNDSIYQFLDRKRTEGKNYYSYMSAGSAKFLRIYYARVKEFLDKYYDKT